MSVEPAAEDLAIQAAFARLDLGADPEAAVDAGLVRDYVELFGLLPVALASAAPSPALRGRVLAAALAARPSARETSPPLPPLPASPRQGGLREVDDLTLLGARRPADDLDRTLVRPRGDVPPSVDLPPPVDFSSVGELRPAERPTREEEISGVRGLPRIGPASRVPERRGGALPLALAAMLGVCLVGLAYFAGRAREQADAVARLTAALRASESAVLGTREREAELERTRRRLEMVTNVAQLAYRMHADVAEGAGDAPADGPTGIVYVCGEHQQWYLSLRGLAPPPAGKRYVLWFLTPGGAVHGGILEVGPGAPAEAEAPTMPAGTTGFAVTLEDSGDAAQPTSPWVLLGDHAVPL